MNAQSAHPRVLSASTLEDTDVYNTEGKKLGEIEEIMIDPATGSVAYAVLEFHQGFLNMKEKLFAIPWKAMYIDTEREQIILNVPEEKLKEAPGFDKNDWPNMADTEFQNSMNIYYSSYYSM